MTDKNQLPDNHPTTHEDAIDAEVIEATSEGSTTEDDNQRKQKKSKTGLLWLFSVFNFLIIIALCAGAYWYYMQVDGENTGQQTAMATLSKQVNGQIEGMQANMGDLQTNTKMIESRLLSKNESMQQSLQSIQQEIEQSTSANADMTKALTKRLSELSGRRPSDWLLAEANYLVNMASRKLYIEQDIKTAMTLLKEADARLDDLSDPSLFPVRALIAADIQTLQQVNPTSTSTIALRLAGMLPKVSELPLDKLQLPENIGQQSDALSEDVNDWKSNLALTWKAIVGDLISIDQIDEPLEPYLAERQQWLIEQQLNHALSQAQTAALNEQAEIYRAATQQAVQLIEAHYQLENVKVKSFLSALKELQSVDFSRNYPSKLTSQASLKDIIDQRIQGLFNNKDEVEQEASGNAL